jgi:hypothetical protein
LRGEVVIREADVMKHADDTVFGGLGRRLVHVSNQCNWFATVSVQYCKVNGPFRSQVLYMAPFRENRLPKFFREERLSAG